MKRILLLGAGRSSTFLIEYLLDQCTKYDWELEIGDLDVSAAQSKIGGHGKGIATLLNIHDEQARKELIHESDIVISLLPAFLHKIVAQDCLAIGKDLATASYLSEEIASMAAEVELKGLAFANELGLDPGIDHMTACALFDQIKSENGKIHTFRSYTGGLVAPSSDNNPWHYKVSWNPRNVILAGQGTSQFTEDGLLKYIPYSRLFREATKVDIKGYGPYAMYVNRDSNKYIELYGLEGIQTMIRGTLRHPDFADTWSIIAEAGLTDSTTKLTLDRDFIISSFTDGFLSESGKDWWERLEKTIGRSISQQQYKMIEWLGLFSDEKIPLQDPSPAEILEYLIVKKWVLNKGDKDLVVMQHEIGYFADGHDHTIYSTLYHEGRDDKYTAMAELVGLPLAIYVKLRLLKKIDKIGVFIPTEQTIYGPILEELEEMGVKFREIKV